jgi:hypothetical protein
MHDNVPSGAVMHQLNLVAADILARCKLLHEEVLEGGSCSSKGWWQWMQSAAR